jgi:protochlorophyllide reductase
MSKFKMPTYDPNQEKIQEKFGDKKLVVITGTSSGLGRKAALALLRSGEYHVVGAVRDLDKMEAVAEVDGFDLENFTPMYCELNSFESVRKFCKNVEEFRMSKPIDRLICNAGVYQPTLSYPKWSMDNHEQTMQINYLSHFLMVSELMEAMIDSSDPRVIMVGSVTGNDNTVGGGGVYPIADLHELDGFKAGFKNPIAMADGYGFIGAKAYKDSKLCLMMMANFLHTKYHKLTGISFSSMYPGCIAESPLFREKRAWFRKYFPIFMKFITGGFVGEHEAGQRLFQVAHDPRCSKSGVYWSWNGGPREGRGVEALEKGGQISGGGGAGGGWDSIFENDQSSKVLDIDTAIKLFEYSTKITEAQWPKLKQVTSPCPTLKVIGAVTQAMVKREELKRMREMDRPGMSGIVTPAEPIEITKGKKAVLVADKVASNVLSGTVGRLARFAGRRLLGEIPEEAKTGSFHDDSTKSSQAPPIADLEGTELIEQAISAQLKKEKEEKPLDIDTEDEALFRELYNEGNNKPETKTEEKPAVKV